MNSATNANALTTVPAPAPAAPKPAVSAALATSSAPVVRPAKPVKSRASTKRSPLPMLTTPVSVPSIKL